MPASECIQQCRIVASDVVTAQVPSSSQLVKFTPVQVEPLDLALIPAREFRAEPVYIDSSGLFLKVGVLRI